MNKSIMIYGIISIVLIAMGAYYYQKVFFGNTDNTEIKTQQSQS